MQVKSILLLLLLYSCFCSSCKQQIKQQEDDLYSRHLQRHVKLNILNTPIPTDTAQLNLLLLNDGQEWQAFRIRETMDSLYSLGLIQPLLVVAIQAGDRMKEYGVAGFPDYNKNGDKADKYAAFIDDELYAFAKKKAGVRKFNSIAIAGCSLGGLSAFDIAWNHADKIDKVGVFSGSFWWRDKDALSPDYSDDNNRIMLSTIKSSRKKPKLQYWFYAGDKEEEGDRDKDGIIDVVDDTKDLIEIIKNKNVCSSDDIRFTASTLGKHDYNSWSQALPSFLLWAFGK